MTATHLALVLWGGFPDDGSMVDQSVLGRLMACLQRTEQGLLGTQNLHGGSGLLGQVQQAPCISYED